MHSPHFLLQRKQLAELVQSMSFVTSVASNKKKKADVVRIYGSKKEGTATK
jgi:hypothetical protein